MFSQKKVKVLTQQTVEQLMESRKTGVHIRRRVLRLHRPPLQELLSATGHQVLHTLSLKRQIESRAMMNGRMWCR